MKIKIKKANEINAALKECAKVEKLDPKVSYAIARNINRLKDDMEKYEEDNFARIKAFAKRAPDGSILSRGGEIIFGINYDTAQEKYLELISKEMDFEPYTIERSEETDKLPPSAMAELLDLIIIDNK
jgi:hypothetical protein